MSYELLEPILDGGVRHSHYFNGRLLTADALRQDQAASRAQRQHLGRAIGAGIAGGLDVRVLQNGSTPVLRVTAGLALNHEGQALALPADTDVALVEPDEPPPAGAGLFEVCLAPAPGIAHSGHHVYFLVLGPASGYRERAPMYDLGYQGDSNGVASGCGYRYAVEGVQFRLVRINLADTDVVPAAIAAALNELIGETDDASLTLLRNRLAHLALGSGEAAGFVANLFDFLDHDATAPRYGLAERMLTTAEDADLTVHLTPCDVPLALFYWAPAGIQFVDNWAARRRVIRPAATMLAEPLVSDRRVAEGEAAFLQFQAQVADLTRPGIPQMVLDGIRARDYFHFLPPVGVVPLTGIGSARGFDYATFFDGIPTRDPLHIEGAKLPAFVRQSFHFNPVPIGGEEVTMMWLYTIRENQQALLGSAPPQSYLVFSSGHLPFQGDARYDVNRYQYSHYGIIDRNTDFDF
jgi:hypothetical protein